MRMFILVIVVLLRGSPVLGLNFYLIRTHLLDNKYEWEARVANGKSERTKMGRDPEAETRASSSYSAPPV